MHATDRSARRGFAFRRSAPIRAALAAPEAPETRAAGRRPAPRVGVALRPAGLWALSLLVLAACGEGGTQLGSPPATLIAVSMPVDTVVTGERTDPPVSVRVEDALGNPIEGTPVRFVVTTGGGTLFPGVAVSGRNGIAEATFEADGSPGASTVRADIPSAPNVLAVDFTIFSEAADSVVLLLREGREQRAEVGSQLPIPFVIEARTPSGSPAGGIPIVFDVAGERRSAALTADSVLTGPDGVARTVLTLGREAGDYEVLAHAGRGVLSDTARFMAVATATFEGSVVLDSVASGTLATGGAATLFGHGFSPVPSENQVRIEGTAAEVLDATGTSLSIRVPDFGGACLPTRDVGVRVLVAEESSNGRIVPLEPLTPALQLAVGDVVTLRGPDAIGCLQFVAGETARRYRLALASTDRRAGRTARASLSTRVETDAGDSRPPSLLSARAVAPALAEEARRHARADGALRQFALRELSEEGARPARRVPPAEAALADAIPAVGDPLDVRFAVGSDLVSSCEATGTPIAATVRAVGEHLVLAADDASPSGGFGPDEWAALLAELDGTVFPAEEAYFGTPPDLDGNGRVIVLFTPRVNALAAPGAAGIGGFFLPLDLAAAAVGPGTSDRDGACPASNEAEILYLSAPDPEGTGGLALAVDAAVRSAKGVVAHELQHLINLGGRTGRPDGGFADAEEIWLDEALSAIGEEAAGLAAIERAVDSDLGWSQVGSTREEREAFDAYQLGNFLGLRLYLSDPAATPVLAGGGTVDTRDLGARGFGWLLLRWAGERAVGDERTFFRRLAGGGRDADRGLVNLERASGVPWRQLLADAAVALATDGEGPTELADRYRIETWDLRDVFAGLSARAESRALFPRSFPLEPTRLAVETAAVAFDVGASTVRYFELATQPDGPALSLGVLTPAGARLSESSDTQITIVRIQ